MATYYVDSNATGLNDGSSWTDAWTSLSSAFSIAAGDTVLISSAHNESNLNSISFTNSTSANPVKLISANSTSSQAEYGATLGATAYNGKSFNRSVYVYGCIFDSGYGYNLSNTSAYAHYKFVNCRFNGTASDPWIQGFKVGQYYSRNDAEFIDCVWDFSKNTRYNQQSISAENTTSKFVNCQFLNTAGQNEHLVRVTGGPNAAIMEFNSCDLTKFDNLVSFVGTNRSQGVIQINNCELKSGFGTFVASPVERGQILNVSNSSSGAISSQNNLTLRADYYGESTNETSVYRSSGANNGGANFSWKITSSSTTEETYSYFESADISRWVNAGSQTITVYIAGSASLNNDDFWIEVESPSELASPTAQGKFRTTKPEPLATPTALASDTSTWTGTGVGTVQKIEVPISPTIAGTVTVRCHLAKPSTTVYVDPKLSGTGYQRVYNGVLVDDNETITTTTSTAGTQIYPFRQFVSDKFGAVLHPLRSN